MSPLELHAFEEYQKRGGTLPWTELTDYEQDIYMGIVLDRWAEEARKAFNNE